MKNIFTFLLVAALGSMTSTLYAQACSGLVVANSATAPTVTTGVSTTPTAVTTTATVPTGPGWYTSTANPAVIRNTAATGNTAELMKVPVFEI